MIRLTSVRRRIADAAPVWTPLFVLVAGWLYFPWCEQGPDLCLWKALFNRHCVGCGRWYAASAFLYMATSVVRSSSILHLVLSCSPRLPVPHEGCWITSADASGAFVTYPI